MSQESNREIPPGMFSVYGRIPGTGIPTGAERVYSNVPMNVVTYVTKPECIAKMLPPPLEPNPMMPPFISGALFCPDTYFGTDGRDFPYREFGFYLPCKYKEHQGITITPLYLSGPYLAPALTAGREIYGYPKEGADIHVYRRGNRTNGTVIREGLPVVSITTFREDEIDPKESLLAQVETVLLVKEIPNATFTGYDVRKIIGCKFSDILEVTKAWNAKGTVTLANTESDPLADLLPVVEMGPCFEFNIRGMEGAGAVNPNSAVEIEDLLK